LAGDSGDRALRADPAAPPSGTRLCALTDLADPGAKGFIFRAGERLFTVFVVRKGENAFGFRDRCPHAGMPLAAHGDNFLTRAGDLILCASHGALFRLEDGVCVGGPCAGAALETFPVIVRDGAVLAG
jgi:nitrite reductase/ring-hydroxylating ferredoxin subunit